MNMLYSTEMFWDGRAANLEEQFKDVLTNVKEMDLNFEILIERIQKDELLKASYEKAFPKKKITERNLIKAMVSFEKSILSVGSRFDNFVKGDASALRPEEIRGLNLFIGKAKCITCHSGANFTDNEFHNTGTLTEDEGRQPFDPILMKNEFEMRPYPFCASFKAFKTPSLRNISKSEPDLESVIEFYNQGGKNPDKKGLAKGIEILSLTEQEKKDLIAFLKSLDTELPSYNY